MFYPGRRPGLLGTAERIVGVAKGGRPAELRRLGTGWAYFVDDQQVEIFDDHAEALQAIPASLI